MNRDSIPADQRNREAINMLLLEAANKTSEDNGNSGIKTCLSENTLKKYTAKLGATDRTYEVEPEARFAAKFDFRNYIYEAAVQCAFMNQCDPNYIVTWDGVQFYSLFYFR